MLGSFCTTTFFSPGQVQPTLVPVPVDFGKLDYKLEQLGKGYVSCSATALVSSASPEGGSRLAQVAAPAVTGVPLPHSPLSTQSWQPGEQRRRGCSGKIHLLQSRPEPAAETGAPNCPSARRTVRAAPRCPEGWSLSHPAHHHRPAGEQLGPSSSLGIAALL